MKASLIDMNVKSKHLVNSDLLVYGACISKEQPKLFKEISKGRLPLGVCLEGHHMNVVGFKIATILKTARPKSMVVLTVDGSPHCVQLHFAAQQAKLLTDSKIELSHYVVEKGELIKLTPESIRVARHLSTIKKSLRCKEGT